jgi:hypothetical protein
VDNIITTTGLGKSFQAKGGTVEAWQALAVLLPLAAIVLTWATSVVRKAVA